MHLSEDDLLLRAMDGAPGADAPLQRTANVAQIGVTAQRLLEDSYRANAGRRLQHRHDLGLKNIGKRTGTAFLPGRL